MFYIYKLICPLTYEVKYIGLTKNPEKRVKSYLKDVRLETPNSCGKAVHKWIKELRSKKLMFILRIIEQVTDIEKSNKERYWISFYKNIGCQLLNVTNGGEYGTEGSVLNPEKSLKILQFIIDKRSEGVPEGRIEKELGIGKGTISSLRSGKNVTAKNLDITIPPPDHRFQKGKGKGYYYDKRGGGKYRACAWKDGKNLKLGSYDTAEEARAKYLEFFGMTE